MPQLQSLSERLRTSLWFVPALFVVAAVVLGAALVSVDHALAAEPGALFFVYSGSEEGARSVLSVIAQSMLTFTGLVFSITMLVLQLASSQLSPRVMRTFLRDRANQAVLGLFVATFVFTLVVLREVRSATDATARFIPGISVFVAFGLLLASVGAFVYYIDHMAQAIRASTVIRNIWQETVEAIERLYPERLGHEPGDATRFPVDEPPVATLKAQRAGHVVGVAAEELLDAATGDRRLELIPSVGDFVAEDAPLVALWGSWDRAAADSVRSAIAIGRERTLAQDAAFGFRQLVDVAVRALSPGTNDPTTAVQALDRLHDLLRRTATRKIPSPVRSHEGRPRLLVHRPDWDDYVHLALDEIRLSGQSQLQVERRIRAILLDLLAVAPPERQAVLRDELQRLDAAAERAYPNTADRAQAAVPSLRGHALATRLRRGR